MTFDLSGKRVLVTQANDYMGPQSVETFREAGAEVIADTANLTDPEAPARIVLRLVIWTFSLQILQPPIITALP